MLSEAAVRAALATVRDPELDEPITELGFVSDLRVAADGHVEVHLRLPTYFCAPNFAWVMVEDARAALEKVPGARSSHVVLDDHFASEEITQGIAGRRGFAAAFSGLADGDLDELRRVFRRKALVARVGSLMARLREEGYPEERQAGLRLADLPGWPETTAYLRCRAELGLGTAPEDPFLIDDQGRPIPARLVSAHLRRSQLTAVSVEGNRAFCRGLLSTRYPGTNERSAP